MAGRAERGRRGGRQRGPGPGYPVGPSGRREPAGEDRLGHLRRADRPVGSAAARRRARAPGAPPQPAQFLQDGVQAHAGDELHDVVVMAVVPPHAEDRDDVGVVQPRRRPRLPLEPQHLLGVGEGRIGEDLQGHASAERLLLGLVDDAHAAAADLAEDAVVAQPLQPRRGVNGHAAGGVVGAVGAEVLHADQDGEDLADLVGELGVAPAVVLEGGPLAAALAAEEVVGQGLDGVAVAAGAGGGAHVRLGSRRRGWDGGLGSPTFVHAGDRGEDLLEPLQGPDVSVARGLVGQAEHQRGLLVAQ